MTTSLRNLVLSTLALALISYAATAEAAPRPGSRAKDAPLNRAPAVSVPTARPAAAAIRPNIRCESRSWTSPTVNYFSVNPGLNARAAGYSNALPSYGYTAGGVDAVTLNKCARLGFVGEIRATGGFQVTSVEPDGPAEEAGLMAGDVIVAANGIPVQKFDDALHAVRISRGKIMFDVLDLATGNTVRRWLSY